MSDPKQPSNADSPVNLEQAVGDFERDLITRALETCGGVQTQAAKYLGTTRRILRYRMDKLGIKPQRGNHP